MIINISGLIMNVDDITLVTTDTEVKTITSNPFRLFEPSTWFAKSESYEEITFLMKIYYTKNKVANTYIWRSDDSGHVLRMIEEVAGQIKLQVNVQNQEMVDKLFEDAVKES